MNDPILDAIEAVLDDVDEKVVIENYEREIDPYGCISCSCVVVFPDGVLVPQGIQIQRHIKSAAQAACKAVQDDLDPDPIQTIDQTITVGDVPDGRDDAPDGGSEPISFGEDVSDDSWSPWEGE
jgi:hypothetical protein